MDVEDLGTCLDRLERSNRRLRAAVVVCALAIVGLGIVALRPATAEAQSRVYAARSFQLTDDSGAVRAQFSLGPDGQPSLRMWQGQGGVEVEGATPFISLGTAMPDHRGGTYLTMGDSTNGLVMISTGRDGQQPSAAIFQAGGGVVWSAP